MSEHIIGVRAYVTVYAVLLSLTALTVGAAYTDLGRINIVLMLVIAAVKATLVVLWFMHVRFESRLVHVAAAAGFAWLAILISFTMSDYLTRAVVTGWSASG